MSVAYTVLFLWPVVVVVLFRRYDVPVAAAWAVIAGYLFLPGEIGINLPILPNINKDLVPSAAAILMAALAIRKAPDTAGVQIPKGWLPRLLIMQILLVMLIASFFMTTFTNGGGLNYGSRSLPGLKVYDAFSTSLAMMVALLPFIVGRKFLADPESHKRLLLILCLAGLIYSLPALYEVRMSPQLNKIVYGYSISGWRTNLRGDGFRPFVFLEHGLWLAIFLAYSLLATFGYLRAGGLAQRRLLLAATVWLFITLVLVKSLGALLIVLILIPVILFFGVRIQLLAAAVIAVAVLTYPALRGTGIMPTAGVVALAEKIDVNRASSLAFRMRHEDSLLEKANQKPLFGWGGWGRSRIYNAKGQNLSVTDGRWVIVIGLGGWTRYITEFGLLTLPIILLAFRRRTYEITLATSALCLVLAVNLIDLIPNATLTPITWLMAGALAGRLELQRITARDGPAATAGVARSSRYRRDPLPSRCPSDIADPRPAEGSAYTRQTHPNNRSKRHRP